MASIPKEKINNLILNYFIQEGYQEAAISFSKELNIDVYKSLPFEDSLHHHYQHHQHHHSTNASSSANDRSIQFIRKMNSLNNAEFTNMVEHYFDDADSHTLASSKGTNHSNIPYFRTNLTSGYSTIRQRKEIKLLILKGSITEAIKKISEYFPTILDTNNLLHFKLLRLNLIEMIRDHKLNINVKDNDDESIFLNNILTFVRENLINKVSNSFKLLKELEITMSLLCFNFDASLKNIEDQKDLPDELRLLFDLSLRNQCYRLVNKSILSLYSNSNSTNLSNVTSGGAGDENDNEYNFINQAGAGGLGGDNDTNAGHGSLIFNKSEQSNSPIYKGPKFIEYDLNNFMFNEGGEEEEDDDDDEGEDDEDDEEGVEEIEYNIEYDKTLSQFMSAHDLSQDDSNSNGNGNDTNRDNLDEELSKLQSLSLESKLERIIKLWTITEQRLLELNIIKQKRYSLNDEL